MIFKKVTFLKTEAHLCFPLFSLLEPLMQRSLDANFLGEIVTSQAVLVHLGGMEPWSHSTLRPLWLSQPHSSPQYIFLLQFIISLLLEIITNLVQLFISFHFTSLHYSILFYSILFYSILFYSILFYSILFYSILFYSILFYSMLFYSTLFYSILFYSISSFKFYFILETFEYLQEYRTSIW